MDFTYETVNKLYAKGIINAKERSLLRSKILTEQNQIEGLSSRFIGNLVTDFKKGWADLVVALKQTGETAGAGTNLGAKTPTGIADIILQLATTTTAEGGLAISPNAKAAWHALQLLTLSPIVTAAGRASGEHLQDVLLKHGVGPDVAAVASTLLDAGAQMRVASGMARAAGVLPKASEVLGWFNQDKAAAQKFADAISDQTAKKAQAIVAAKAKADAPVFTSSKEPAEVSAEVVRRAKEFIDSQESGAQVIARNEQTHDLLAKAMETIQPKLTETEKTLQAAASTIRGGNVLDTAFNAKQLKTMESAGDNILELMKRPGAVKGGAPSYQDYIDAGKRAQATYAEGKRVLEMGKTKISDIEDLARQMVGKNLDDLKNITPGDPVDPLEVIANSMAVKDHAQEFMKLVGTMRKDWADGNKGTFYRAWAEFHKMLEVDPNYRMPLQTAGQTLRAAGNPAVNSTRYLDEIVKTGSWINGEKLNTLDELEANALNIMSRMEQIPSWEKAASWAKKIAGAGEEELRDPTFRDKAYFFFVNNILSSTDTIGRNISGNMVAAPWHYAEKMTGVAAAKVLNPFLSAEHHIEAGYASEANHFAMTWASSMWDASRYALTRRWDKLAEMVPGNARADLFAGRFELTKFKNTGTTNPFGGMTGRVVGMPVSIAQAADEVARVAIYRGAVAERLRHDWLASGSKMSWGDFRERGFANLAPEMHDYGIRQAGLMTYSDDPSVFGRILMMGRQMLPGSEFIQTFIRTTDRLLAYGYNRTPVLSALSTKTLSEFRSGDPLVRQEMIGRILLANITGVGLLLASRAKAPDGETFITGGGPTNRALAKSLRDGGVIHPYTFWTPAGRWNYHPWQPIAGPLGMIADTAEVWDELKHGDAESLWDGITLGLSSGFSAFGRNYLDTTYNNLGSLMRIFDDPNDRSNLDRVASQIGVNLVKGFVPASSLVRQMLRNYDPVVKESYGILDELLKEVPGYGGPPKINPRTGEPVMNPPRLLQGTPFGWFLPTAPIQVEDDAVRNKFLELKIPFPEFPKAYGGGNPSQSSFAYSGPLGPVKEAAAGVAYTPEQINKGQRYIHEPDDSGLTADQELKDMLTDPEFHKLAPIIQAEQIRAVYNGRMHNAVERLREEYPELDTQLEAKQQLRGELRMNPEDRAGIEAEDNATPEPEAIEESHLENPTIDVEQPVEAPVQ